METFQWKCLICSIEAPDQEEEEDADDPDFDAMIEEGVKAGQLRVKV